MLEGIIIAAVIIPLLIGLPALALLLYYNMYKSHFKILGVSFRCDPEEMKVLIDQATIFKYLNIYAVGMAEAFGTTKDVILTHYTDLTCLFQKGFLSNDIRERFGLADGNQDGKADLITGLTYGKKSIVVAVLFPEHIKGTKAHNMIDANGKVIIVRTALMYEVHNSVMEGLKGYATTLAEGFVKPTDERIQRLLGVDQEGLQALLLARAKYDNTFRKLRFD